MKLLKKTILLFIPLSTLISAQELSIPEPSGSYSIGVNYLYFVDSDRPELFTEDESDFRDITVKVWYPAEDDKSKDYAPYLKNNNLPLHDLRVPEIYNDIITHSKLYLPILNNQNPYPVLIFNHGWGEHYSQNTILMEELASHGFIVFSIGHHYEAKFSFFPGGSFITFDFNNTSERFQNIMREQQNPEAMEIFRKMFDTRTQEEQESIFTETGKLLPTLVVDGPRLWAEDIIFLINQLEKLNDDNVFFKDRLDTGKIGVFGMSLGGIATSQACLQDKRIKAGISMDGGLYGDTFNSTITQPFMFINSKRYISYEEIFLKHIKNEGIVITIEDSDHYNFHDISIIDKSHPWLGTIDGDLMLQLLNKYTLAFYNKFLKGIESEIFDPNYSKYENINIAIKNL
ncbi:alpha/beta hydrolase family protein [Bacteroidota bacterium]